MLPKKDDPARGRRKTALHGHFFSKHFQISGCFLQGFPKIPLAVLWDFKGLRWIKTEKAPLQIFCLLPGLDEPVARRQTRLDR
jgi:hypothetical protein